AARSWREAGYRKSGRLSGGPAAPASACRGATVRRPCDGDGARRRTGGGEGGAAAPEKVAVRPVCQYRQPGSNGGDVVRCRTRGVADRVPVLSLLLTDAD